MSVPDPILTSHLAHLRLLGRTPGTIYARRRALIRMAARLPVPLLDAGPAELLAWRAGLRVTGNTVVHYASHANDFYRWAAGEGLIAANPLARVPLPVLVRGLPRPIGEADLMTAVAAAPPRIRPWLVLAGWAGLRAKEIAFLRRERILDTAAPPVLLVAADATKGRRERIVPLCRFALGELHAAALPRAGYVFRRRDGRPGPNLPAKVSQLANAHLAGCGIDATLHQLRHRFGTMTYRATLDLRLVQELMGHADPATTALYAAFCDRQASAAVEALPVPGQWPAAA